MNRRKKILFFDSWTKGIHNFSSIANELQKHGYESLLVHRGSWEHDRGRPLEEKIDGVLCRDIQYYRTRFVYSVFNRENPDLVLILTTNYLFDRAVILAARSLDIKTCFLMHGIRAVGEKSVALQKSTPSTALYKKRWLNVIKYIQYTIPNYFLSGLLNNWRFLFRIEPYCLLMKLFLKPHHYVAYPTPSNEIHCDLALVWGNIYKHFFIQEYGYPENRVKVVGHPPLDLVYILLNHPPEEEEKKLFLKTSAISNKRPYCVYLEDGSVEQGSNEWTTRTRIAHLEEIAVLCKKAGKDLVIKLHPSTDRTPIESFFKNNRQVKVVVNIDLNRLIYWSDKVIGQGSTTNDIAIALTKPLLLPAWGISELSSKVTFDRQPSAILCETPDAFVKSLTNNNELENNKSAVRDKYIEDFITLKDGKAVERITNYIIDAIK